MSENTLEEILQLIPHRPPFLWVDTILSLAEDHIETAKTIPDDLAIFQGHYPGHPLMPGVLLCEAVFQSGAMLIAQKMADEKIADKLPLLTRIQDAKFKREVKPGDTIYMQVKVVDREGPAWFMKGKVMIHDKTAVKVKFVCTLAGKERP